MVDKLFERRKIMWPADNFGANDLHQLILKNKTGKVFYRNYLHADAIKNLAHFNRGLKPDVKMFGFLNAQEFSTRGEFNELVVSELN